MKGILIDNYYKMIDNMKILVTLLFALGTLIIFFIDSQIIMQGYIVAIFLSISIYSLSNNCKDIETGWQKYELILPVERKQIVMSKYLMTFFWMILASILTAIYVLGIFIVKGKIYFDLGMEDVITIFVTVMSFSIIIYSWYYLLWFLLDAEKKELLSIISIIISTCTIGVLIWFLNMRGLLVEKSRVIIFAVSIIELFTSYQLVKKIYQNKEY